VLCLNLDLGDHRIVARCCLSVNRSGPLSQIYLLALRVWSSSLSSVFILGSSGFIHRLIEVLGNMEAIMHHIGLRQNRLGREHERFPHIHGDGERERENATALFDCQGLGEQGAGGLFGAPFHSHRAHGLASWGGRPPPPEHGEVIVARLKKLFSSRGERWAITSSASRRGEPALDGTGHEVMDLAGGQAQERRRFALHLSGQ